MNFWKTCICFSAWLFKVINLCLRSSVLFGNLRLMLAWSDQKWRWRFEALKCTNNAWHTRQNGLLLRSTKKCKLSHSVKNALCSSSYFRFAVHFSFAIITKIYEKLKNANIINLSTCTKNTTGRFLQNQAADRRNKACEKEPHETRQRAACGSRASGWPPLS